MSLLICKYIDLEIGPTRIIRLYPISMRNVQKVGAGFGCPIIHSRFYFEDSTIFIFFYFINKIAETNCVQKTIFTLFHKLLGPAITLTHCEYNRAA